MSAAHAVDADGLAARGGGEVLDLELGQAHLRGADGALEVQALARVDIPVCQQREVRVVEVGVAGRAAGVVVGQGHVGVVATEGAGEHQPPVDGGTNSNIPAKPGGARRGVGGGASQREVAPVHHHAGGELQVETVVVLATELGLAGGRGGRAGRRRGRVIRVGGRAVGGRRIRCAVGVRVGIRIRVRVGVRVSPGAAPRGRVGVGPGAACGGRIRVSPGAARRGVGVRHGGGGRRRSRGRGRGRGGKGGVGPRREGPRGGRRGLARLCHGDRGAAERRRARQGCQKGTCKPSQRGPPARVTMHRACPPSHKG